MLILGIIALVIGTAVVVTIPLTQKDMSTEEPAYIDLTLAKLEEEKESAYNALKEAEFDYETGKLSDEDFQAIKDKYGAKAVEAMKKLENYQGKKVGGTKRESSRGLSPKNFCSSCGAKIEKGAKFCGSCGIAQIKAKANICARCGAEHKKGARFCASCGQAIAD